MKCPACAKEGKTSRVYPHGGSVTLMYCQPFYDEDGKYHDHDSNRRREDYSCSEGHHWIEESYGSCWCGWKG